MQHCSLCSGELGPDGAMVCGGCLRKGAVPVRATGEFIAVQPPPDPEPSEPITVAAAGCTWCGKDGAAVKKLLGNGAVAICNECVALCADVMHAELGEGWRG